MISKKQIEALSGTITKKFRVKKILLFGSYAFGKPQPESDLDLCLITDLGNRRKIDFIREIRREILEKFQFPIDIILYDNTEFDQRSSLKNTLEYQIAKHGILLNG